MIHLWVRETTDWDDEARFRRQLSPAFAPRVALWDATFALPYRAFRAELKKIAQLNLSRVAGAVVAAHWRDIPEGALVAPADDDDWFAPELAERLAALPAHAGVYWTSSFLEVPIDLGHRFGLLRKRLFPGTRPKWICTTNNYALPKSAEAQPLLQSHVAASRWLEPEPGRLVKLPLRLSLMNRSLASQTSLGRFKRRFGRRALVAKWAAYRELYARPLPPELAWAELYAARMAALMAELTLR